MANRYGREEDRRPERESRRPRRYTKEEVLQAIPGTGGIKNNIARRLGCGYATVKAFIERWPEVAQAVEDERNIVGDVAESVIMDALLNGDLETAKWFARVKLGDRGYVPRTESRTTVDQVAVVTTRVVRRSMDEFDTMDGPDESNETA